MERLLKELVEAGFTVTIYKDEIATASISHFKDGADTEGYGEDAIEAFWNAVRRRLLVVE
jgi:hypothetical protein